MIIAMVYYLSSFLISLINPFWGLVGFVCSLILRFQDHYPALTTYKPFSFLFFGMILGCYLNRSALAKGLWLQDKLIFSLFIISVLGLSVLAPTRLIAESYHFICSISLYFFASRILQTPNQFLILFTCMAASITFLGFQAVQDVMLFADESEYLDPRSGRWQGLGYYANSNEFAQLMISTIPFLFVLLVIKVNSLLKLLALAMMSLMLFVMVQCASRTVMVTLALIMITLFMLRGQGNIMKKVVIGATISVFLLILLTFMPESLQERMGTVLNASEDESFQGRTRSWGYGFDMLSWYPFTGVGKGQWMEYHGLMPHNSYVQIMAELGIFGIFVFLWVLKLCYQQFSILFKSRQNKLVETPLVFSPNTDFFTINAITASSGTDSGTTVEPKIKSNNSLKRAVSLAVFTTFSAWLFYIFLGNQGYSVWTYFYIGLCTALSNFSPKVINKEEIHFKSNLDEVR